MKKEFDWEEFKEDNIAVHCKTRTESIQFCEMERDHGIDFDRASTFWFRSRENTCYSCKGNRWMYGDLDWYRNENYTILEFSDYFETDEPPHYGEIEINGDRFIVKEKEECDDTEWMFLCNLFGLDYDKTERIVIDGVVKYFGMRKGE